MDHACGIISHRGLCRRFRFFPRKGENTIEAFEKGAARLAELGFPPAIEFDVRFTKDEVPVVIHDRTVDRTTDGRGTVKGFLFSDLQKLDAGYGRRIPALSGVLDRFKDEDVTFHIELKENDLAQVVERAVSEHGLAGRVILSAFNYDDRDDSTEDAESGSHWSDLTSSGGRLPVALLATNGKISQMGGASAFVKTAQSLGAHGIHPEQSAVTEELVAAAHEAGLKVNVWTVNDSAVYQRLAGYGVDNVFCDSPDFLV